MDFLSPGHSNLNLMPGMKVRLLKCLVKLEQTAHSKVGALNVIKLNLNKFKGRVNAHRLFIWT